MRHNKITDLGNLIDLPLYIYKAFLCHWVHGFCSFSSEPDFQHCTVIRKSDKKMSLVIHFLTNVGPFYFG